MAMPARILLGGHEPKTVSGAKSPDVALNQIAYWLESPTVRLLSESPAHFAVLADLARSANVAGSQIHDAKIAAICLSHGVRELLTMDRDFSRYPSLKTRSLLA